MTTIPAWRAARPTAASPTVLSGSSSPAKAGSVRPMPAPASSCGTTVQAMLGAGRNASAAAPPASSTAPASARGRAEPGITAAASAASGRIVTPSAARRGDIANPATSSITSRNRTDVNAAAVKASATSARGEASPHCTRGRRGASWSGASRSSSRMRAVSVPEGRAGANWSEAGSASPGAGLPRSTTWSRKGAGWSWRAASLAGTVSPGPTGSPGRAVPRGRAGSPGRAASPCPGAPCDHRPPPGCSSASGSRPPRAAAPTRAGSRDAQQATAAAAASGACTTKIARQSKSSVSRPPIAGPAAVPISAAPSHSRRPDRDSPASSTWKAASSAAAPPAACSARNTSSTSSEPASAQPSEAPANSARPHGPARRASKRAAGRIPSASTSA